MPTLFEELERLRGVEERVAMATLVATRGTAPKKEGAKMWVGQGGRVLGSVTIGGCVDARVIEESGAVLASATPRLLSLALGDEEAQELGLTCAGTVDVLLEPLDCTSPDDPLLRTYAHVAEEVAAGRHAAVVTRLGEPVAGHGRLLVLEDGSTSGTLGDAALDRAARERALELLWRGASRTEAVRGGAEPVEAFFEVHAPPPLLVVFGAGQIAIPLVSFAKRLGMSTVVVDARPQFATADRFPDADRILIGIPSEIAGTLRYAPSTIVVLVAHDYKYDLPVLKTILGGDACYIGMLGSRKRGRAILEFLAEAGVPPEVLRRVHVPSGLDLGAQTAAEIALSILAEALAVRAGRGGGPLRERAGGVAP